MPGRAETFRDVKRTAEGTRRTVALSLLFPLARRLHKFLWTSEGGKLGMEVRTDAGSCMMLCGFPFWHLRASAPISGRKNLCGFCVLLRRRKVCGLEVSSESPHTTGGSSLRCFSGRRLCPVFDD